jgi:hypothetical protein
VRWCFLIFWLPRCCDIQKAARTPENSSGKPTMIRKSSLIIPAPNEVWTHGKKSTMTQQGSRKKNSDAAFGKIFRISKFFPQKGSLNFQNQRLM